MLEIKPATLRDATYVAANMREADKIEIAEVVGDAKAEELAAALLQCSGVNAWCVFERGQPVAVFGVSLMFKGCGSGWAFGTRRLARAVPTITKFCMNTLGKRLMRDGFRRVEIRTSANHDLSHKWLEGMGASFEGVARHYGISGTDFKNYAFVAADWKKFRKAKK